MCNNLHKLLLSFNAITQDKPWKGLHGNGSYAELKMELYMGYEHYPMYSYRSKALRRASSVKGKGHPSETAWKKDWHYTASLNRITSLQKSCSLIMFFTFITCMYYDYSLMMTNLMNTYFVNHMQNEGHIYVDRS